MSSTYAQINRPPVEEPDEEEGLLKAGRSTYGGSASPPQCRVQRGGRPDCPGRASDPHTAETSTPMSVYGYARGHRIDFDETDLIWRYADTGELFDLDHERPCTLCHKPPTPEGYDACLGELPGVLNACCGHGVEDGYIHYEKRPFWMTTKNNWPLAIWLTALAPFLLFTAMSMWQGLSCDCGFAAGVRPLLLPWATLGVVALLGAVVAIKIRIMQLETRILILSKILKALKQ